MAYDLKGSLLEVCTCEIICPCWVGADPDGGKCEGTMAWHFESGDINGVDVSGLTLGMVANIPGNVLNGNWRAVVYVDENASAEQEEALLSVFTGKEGGPVADMAALVGEVVAVERAAIEFRAEDDDKGRQLEKDQYHHDLREPCVEPRPVAKVEIIGIHAGDDEPEDHRQ